MTVSDQSELSGTPKYRLHWCMECAHLDQSLQTVLGIQEMHNYNLEHLCVGECGWTGSRREVTQDGSTILFSVKDNAYSSGVAPYCKQTSSQISDDAEGNHLRYTKQSRVYLKLLQFHHLAVSCPYQQGRGIGQR